ncbi:hypothetical protein D3C81_849360 [compost metagenome]
MVLTKTYLAKLFLQCPRFASVPIPFLHVGPMCTSTTCGRSLRAWTMIGANTWNLMLD